ncbi:MULTISPECIES: hypothetical protein [unclassified Streptomyces]|uniref:DUF7144 family membrane protein n=1 Tax=unclassified Streptomyces TaxID=2593676 RepID=UPI001F03D591|nr:MULTISPECIES: hypothetical protein [unclassified Streptomyces]MCH0563154.1 hypothetical protein [Streptomyces sp. MUM 2J]MCH0568583.1 hypothetical protein [Streptomyces sp. MUM 136J]
MATQSHPQTPSGGYRSTSTGNSPWVTGGATFAGVLLFVNGVLGVLQGVAAIAKDDVYARIGDYVYKINLTGWGWILLVLGVIAAFAGWGVLVGAGWARAVGIALASLNLITQFMFLPYSPVWSVIMMAINIFVIWALAVYRPSTAPR